MLSKTLPQSIHNLQAVKGVYYVIEHLFFAQQILEDARQRGAIETRTSAPECRYSRFQLIPFEERPYYISRYSELAGWDGHTSDNM